MCSLYAIQDDVVHLINCIVDVMQINRYDIYSVTIAQEMRLNLLKCA